MYIEQKFEAMNCIIPDFNLLGKQEIELINSNAKTVSFNAKDVIFKRDTPSSHLMFINKGMVKVFKTDKNNKTIILQILLEQNFLGLISIFSTDYHAFSAVAIEPTDIVYVDLNVLKSVLYVNGMFATKFIELVSLNGLNSFFKLDNFIRKQLPGRVADVLLYFSQEVYKNNSFKFPLTRKELAEFAGTTKESFIRTLSEFKNDKIIGIDGKNITINSLEIVKTLSKLG